MVARVICRIVSEDSSVVIFEFDEDDIKSLQMIVETQTLANLRKEGLQSVTLTL